MTDWLFFTLVPFTPVILIVAVMFTLMCRTWPTKRRLAEFARLEREARKFSE